MKNKFLLVALTVLFGITSLNVQASGLSKKELQEKAAAMTDEQKQARVEEMKQRVQEIKAMDKTQLTSIERKELRQELRNMNKEARAIGNGGIYISLAGILIIILVLILIL